MKAKVNIIFLNGVGSVGKTSIAKALQAILAEPYLHVGVDQFIDMLPERYMGHPQGIVFEELQTDKPTIKIKTGIIAATAMRGMRQAIAALAREGNNLIIDEVIIGDEIEDYAKLLVPFNVFYVGVFAPLDEIERRERSRSDRLIGLARWQYDIVHQDKAYDFTIDTTVLTPLECAQMIKAKFNL